MSRRSLEDIVVFCPAPQICVRLSHFHEDKNFFRDMKLQRSRSILRPEKCVTLRARIIESIIEWQRPCEDPPLPIEIGFHVFCRRFSHVPPYTAETPSVLAIDDLFFMQKGIKYDERALGRYERGLALLHLVSRGLGGGGSGRNSAPGDGQRSSGISTLISYAADGDDPQTERRNGKSSSENIKN